MTKDLPGKGTVLLFAATLMVGLSILLDGTPARITNGLAGMMWFAAAAMLVVSGLQFSRRPTLWVGLIGLTAMVAFVVRPSDLLLATFGFLVSGAVAFLLAGDGRLLWSVLVVGLYLPMHIGTAVIKAIVRSMQGNEASIRTDPPPTAALVPLTMLVAALVGSLIVRRLLTGRMEARGLYLRR